MISKHFYDSRNDPFLLVESMINCSKLDQNSTGKHEFVSLLLIINQPNSFTPPASCNSSPENCIGAWIMSSPFDVNSTKSLSERKLLSGRNHLKGIIIKSDKFINVINDLLSIDLNQKSVLLKYINKNL